MHDQELDLLKKWMQDKFKKLETNYYQDKFEDDMEFLEEFAQPPNFDIFNEFIEEEDLRQKIVRQMKQVYIKIGKINFPKMAEDGLIYLSRHADSQDVVEITSKIPFEMEASAIVNLG